MPRSAKIMDCRVAALLAATWTVRSLCTTQRLDCYLVSLLAMTQLSSTYLVVITPTAHFFPAIDNAKKQFGCFFGIVARIVCFAAIKGNGCRFTGLGQYGLSIG